MRCVVCEGGDVMMYWSDEGTLTFQEIKTLNYFLYIYKSKQRDSFKKAYNSIYEHILCTKLFTELLSTQVGIDQRAKVNLNQCQT